MKLNKMLIEGKISLLYLIIPPRYATNIKFLGKGMQEALILFSVYLMTSPFALEENPSQVSECVHAVIMNISMYKRESWNSKIVDARWNVRA